MIDNSPSQRRRSRRSRGPERIVGNPEVESETVRRFEIHPLWVPSLDAIWRFPQMLLGTEDLYRFERMGIYAAKVLDASSVGRHVIIVYSDSAGRGPPLTTASIWR